MRKLLITGGAGYIGSHTVLTLLQQGYELLIADNFSNSSPVILQRLENLAGKPVPCVKVDLRDKQALDEVFKQHGPFDGVVHFAALKAVGESVAFPLRYYDNNVVGSLHLAEVMREHGCRIMVFSSSATVYGMPEKLPIDEHAPLGPINPYGQTKFMMEQVFRDVARAEDWSVVNLRYFNPVGAHQSGDIGEDPQGVPNNLVPFVAQVAVGRRSAVTVFGDDWPTPDGTGVRDYIHIQDLADAHEAALRYALENKGVLDVNLGTGRGYSVQEVIASFREVSGKDIPVMIGKRREGDAAEVVADPSLAKRVLNWEAKHGLDAMVSSSWHWQQKNPHGFEGA